MWRKNIISKIKDIKYVWFVLYPWIFPTVSVWIVYKLQNKYGIHIEMSKGFDGLLSIIATFVSVVIGLLGVLLTCLISIRDTSDIVKYFFEQGQGKSFQRGIKMCIQAGLFSLIATCVMMIDDIYPAKIFNIAKYIWIFLVVYFSAMIYRFISILLELVMNNKKECIGKKDNQEVTGERKAKMDASIPKI